MLFDEQREQEFVLLESGLLREAESTVDNACSTVQLEASKKVVVYTTGLVVQNKR